MNKMDPEQTKEYFQKENYKRGDMLIEMFSYNIYIIDVNEDIITTIEGNKFNLEIYQYTKKDFKYHCSYKSQGIINDKYWVDFFETKKDISKLINYYESTFDTLRELNLQKILYPLWKFYVKEHILI